MVKLRKLKTTIDYNLGENYALICVGQTKV